MNAHETVRAAGLAGSDAKRQGQRSGCPFCLLQRMIHAWTCCVTDSAVGAPCDHVCDQHKYSITRGTWCRAPGIIHANGSRPGAKVLPGTSRYAGRGRPGFCPDINKKFSDISLRRLRRRLFRRRSAVWEKQTRRKIFMSRERLRSCFIFPGEELSSLRPTA